MTVKRIFAVLFTAAALFALLTLSAYARSWWEEASADVAVYPGAPTFAAEDLDRNGLVDAADARQTLRFAVGLDADRLPYCSKVDVNGDDQITAADARQVLRCAVGLEGSAIPQADDGAYRIRVSSMFEKYGELGALVPLEANADHVSDARPDDNLPLWRLCSVADVETFCNAFRAVGIEAFDTIDVPVFLRRYNDAFFADRELFICCLSEGSGSNLQAVYSPVVIKDEREVAYYPLPNASLYPSLARGGTLTFTVGSVCSECCTCDIANWFLFFPVEKAASAGCASFDCRRGVGKILPYAEYRAARDGKTKWAYALEQRMPGGTEITLKPNEETAFALENAQDGGYLWEYQTDAKTETYTALFSSEGTDCDFWMEEALVQKPFAPDAAPGDSGLHLYTVRANKPGVYTLRFSLKRSWETEAINECTVTLIVTG